MRELKFRLYDSKNEIMVPVHSMEWDKISDQLNYVRGYNLKDSDYWGTAVYGGSPKKLTGESIRYLIMQYTGLKDKNGKEIFEGDIVKISEHPFDSSTFGVNGNYEIWYNEYMELCCGNWLLFRMKHYAEVIGNKYENPHLLKVKA
ncbi:YopX family protein [Alkalihalophilus marmarensis]|uniref:YopX family protein n=1 Tax=Alkalihalophilus marmarensis TaxID=521377 RepID=UPI002E1B0C7E|nr:YopX family protein [Alkalihalophilus marmarensis]